MVVGEGNSGVGRCGSGQSNYLSELIQVVGQARVVNGVESPLKTEAESLVEN